jgi:hypothetical protein
MDTDSDRVYRQIVSSLGQSGIPLIDAWDALESRREAWLPDGYALHLCGSCKTSRIVPTGEALARMRVAAGVTQDEVAREMEPVRAAERVGGGSVCDIEKGRRPASERAVRAYFAAIERKKAAQ